MSDERLMDVEIKLMHQEETIETLNKVVLEQTARIDALEKRLAHAIEREAPSGEGAVGFDLDAERPPHY